MKVVVAVDHVVAVEIEAVAKRFVSILNVLGYYSSFLNRSGMQSVLSHCCRSEYNLADQRRLPDSGSREGEP